MNEKLLEENGWIVECHSPLEIRHVETGSFATLIAAQIIINEILEENLKEETVLQNELYKLEN